MARTRQVAVGVACVAAVAALTAAAVVVTDAASDDQVGAELAARTRNADRAPGDIDGDGRTDLVVYRPGTATFWVDQSTGEDLVVSLGQAGDRPTSGDFDGDGRADLVAVRAGTAEVPGAWLIRSSRDGTERSVSFGLLGDVAQPGDYDGDGQDDVAVFRPVGAGEGETADPAPNAQWFVHQSSDGSLAVIPFGIAGDLPVPGDYDADGITDVAVQRAGTRWIRFSSDGSIVARQFGQAGDVPAIIDRDDDGRADLAVVRNDGENQAWYLQDPGEATSTSFAFGRATAPFQQRFIGDFDGDGRTEPAVFDPSIASFWIWTPTEVVAVPWGVDGDLVLPLGVDPALGLGTPLDPGPATDAVDPAAPQE